MSIFDFTAPALIDHPDYLKVRQALDYVTIERSGRASAEDRAQSGTVALQGDRALDATRLVRFIPRSVSSSVACAGPLSMAKRSVAAVPGRAQGRAVPSVALLRMVFGVRASGTTRTDRCWRWVRWTATDSTSDSSATVSLPSWLTTVAGSTGVVRRRSEPVADIQAAAKLLRRGWVPVSAATSPPPSPIRVSGTARLKVPASLP